MQGESLFTHLLVSHFAMASHLSQDKDKSFICPTSTYKVGSLLLPKPLLPAVMSNSRYSPSLSFSQLPSSPLLL